MNTKPNLELVNETEPEKPKASQRGRITEGVHQGELEAQLLRALRAKPRGITIGEVYRLALTQAQLNRCHRAIKSLLDRREAKKRRTTFEKPHRFTVDRLTIEEIYR